jgi:PAS domain S-box-containing protein
MNTPVFSAVHTATCKSERSLIRCRDSADTDTEDELIQSCKVPDRLLAKWQSMVDTSAQLADVPVALIMRVVDLNLQVLVSSNSVGNPYYVGETAPLESSEAYCGAVIRTGERLLVSNALASSAWTGETGQDLKLISYLGLPILWPNRRVFGTICVLDCKENSYDSSFERILHQFRNLIEDHLAQIYTGLDADREASRKPRIKDDIPGGGDERLRSFVERVADEVLVHDESGRILEINQLACIGMGGTRDRLLGKNIAQLSVEFGEDWNPQLWSLAQAGDTATVRATRHDPREGERFLDVRFSCQVTEGRKIFVGLIRDVTETMTPHRRRESEVALVEGIRTGPADDSLRGDTSGLFVVLEGSLRIVRQESEPTAFALNEFLEDVHPVDRPAVTRTLLEAASAGLPFSFVFRVARPGKAILYVACKGKPDDIRSASGRFVGTFSDITRVKRAEDVLGQTHAALSRAIRWAATGELAASVVHEVNQPLGAIANYAGAIRQWLSSGEPDMQEARDAASGLLDAVISAGEIISGLKVIARSPQLVLSNVEITAAVQEILTLARHEFERRAVCLDTQLPVEGVTAYCDRTLLQQLVLNLLHNALASAIASTGCSRQVWLTCERTGTQGIAIAVADNGVGLNESNGEGAFEKLSLDKTEKMGTGLSVCRTIVDAHGGQLWTEPRPDGGSISRLILPGTVR